MYRKIDASEVPKRVRNSESKLANTPEWLGMKADIDAGVKPGVALQLSLTDEDKERYRVRNRRTVARFVQKYLSEHGHEYEVKSFRQGDADYVVVTNPST